MNPQPLDAALKTLRETRVPELPRGFRATVWQAIEARRAHAPSHGWIDTWLQTALRPAGIAIVVAVSVLVGFGFADPATAAPPGLEVFSARALPLTWQP